MVPDNLKTGVTKALRGEPLLNDAYRELVDYYRTVIVPSRVRRPKDKASVEGTVGYISRQIIAPLRNYNVSPKLFTGDPESLNKHLEWKLFITL